MKIWFQNRRTKWKKQDNISNAEAAEHKNQNNPKTTQQAKSKQGNTGIKGSGLLRSTVDCSSDSNNSLLTGDGSVSESNTSEQGGLPTSLTLPPPDRTHLPPGLGVLSVERTAIPTNLTMLSTDRGSLGNHALQKRTVLSPDPVYISRNYDAVRDLTISEPLLREYDFNRELKINSRDFVLGKIESRINTRETNENLSSMKKTPLSEEIDKNLKELNLDSEVKKLDADPNSESIGFTVAPAMTTLRSSDREPMESNDRDYEEPASPQSALQIDEREDVISPELSS